MIDLPAPQSVALGDSSAYHIPEQDRAVMERIGPLDANLELVRCRDGSCYVLRTGEPNGGNPKDGIYLIERKLP